MADFWFPSFSPTGALAVGSQRIQVATQAPFDPKDIGPGTTPHWGNTLFYTRQPDGAFMNWAGGTPGVVRSQGFNTFAVAPDERWVGYRTDPPRLIWSDGAEWTHFAEPALSNTRWACLVQETGALLAGTGNGQNGIVISRNACLEPKLAGDLLVWREGTRIFGQRAHGAPVEALSLPSEAHFWPVPLVVDGEPWVLTHTNDRLLLYKWGSTRGHVIHVGVTDFPAAFYSAGTFHIAWSARGELGFKRLALQTAPVDLTQPDQPTDPIDPPDPEEPPVPQLEANDIAVIEAYVDRFGLPALSKEAGQEWVFNLAATLRARVGKGWGTKRASSSRPPSNESIARHADGRLWGWDLILDAGAAHQRLNLGAHAEDISDQVFIDTPAKDALAGTVPVDPEEPVDPVDPDPPTSVDLTPIVKRLDTLLVIVNELRGRPVLDVDAIERELGALRLFVEHEAQGKLLVLDNKLDQLLSRPSAFKCNFPKLRVAAAGNERFGLDKNELLELLISLLERLLDGTDSDSQTN